MSDTIFSALWYQVADIKPRLRSHAQIHRHTYRGRDWYVLQDHSTGRFHRFSPEAYLIIGLMDGQRTLKEIWDAACMQLGDHMPTQDEVINLISLLHRSDVLLADIPPNIEELQRRAEKRRYSKILGYLKSPMAMRFPLLDPDQFLNRTFFLVRPFLGRAAALVWGLFVMAGLVVAFLHWKELVSNLSDRVLSMQNLLLIWLIYPSVKVVHEFGHAYIVKRWGGEVHEMGVMLLVLTPVPYVDASSSSAFQDKRKRILVGAGGIMIELFLASIAILVWANVGPGAVRSVAFNVIIICGVSTFLFNGNPLLRFDSYYILSDYLEIPNLATRGNQYIGYLLQRYLLGVDSLSPVKSPGEGPWLGTYAVASFVYRFLLMLRIAIFIAGKFFIFGIALALWTIFGIIFPLLKLVHYLFTDVKMQRKRARAMIVCAAAAGLFVICLFVVPFPLFTFAEGVVWVPERSQVYAGADGVISKIVAVPGQAVSRGDLLIVCEDMELTTRVNVLHAELRVLEAQLRANMMTNLTESKIIRDEIERVETELSLAQQHKKGLLVHSTGEGIFLLPQAVDAPGRFVKRGMPLAYVVDFSTLTVRILVPQSEVDQVRNSTQMVEVRLSEDFNRIVPAVIEREVPAASNDLPSPALSLEGGGSFALDPRNTKEQKTFEKLFQFDIALKGIEVNKIGGRAYVRMKHYSEPLAHRWYRDIRRLFLRKFNA